MADAMVKKQWPKVHKLAFALREREKFTGNGRLSGAEIRDLLGGNCRNGSGAR